MSNDLDKLLAGILGGCMEVECAECGVIAQGTTAYHTQIARFALRHQEDTGHHVDICDWAESPNDPVG